MFVNDENCYEMRIEIGSSLSRLGIRVFEIGFVPITAEGLWSIKYRRSFDTISEDPYESRAPCENEIRSLNASRDCGEKNEHPRWKNSSVRGGRGEAITSYMSVKAIHKWSVVKGVNPRRAFNEPVTR